MLLLRKVLRKRKTIVFYFFKNIFIIYFSKGSSCQWYLVSSILRSNKWCVCILPPPPALLPFHANTHAHTLTLVISSCALYSRKNLAQKHVLMGYVSVFWGPACYLWPLSSLILPFSNYLSLLFLLPPPAAPWMIVRRWSFEQGRIRWLLSLGHSSLSERCSVYVHILHIHVCILAGDRPHSKKVVG